MYNQIKDMLLSFFGALLKMFLGELTVPQKKCPQPQMSFALKSTAAQNSSYVIDIIYLPKSSNPEITGATALELSIAHYQGHLDNDTYFTFPIPYATKEGTPYTVGDQFKLTLEVKNPSKKGESAKATVLWAYNEKSLIINAIESSAGTFCFFKESIINASQLSFQVASCDATPDKAADQKS